MKSGSVEVPPVPDSMQFMMLRLLLRGHSLQPLHFSLQIEHRDALIQYSIAKHAFYRVKGL